MFKQFDLIILPKLIDQCDNVSMYVSDTVVTSDSYNSGHNKNHEKAPTYSCKFVDHTEELVLQTQNLDVKKCLK